MKKITDTCKIHTGECDAAVIVSSVFKHWSSNGFSGVTSLGLKMEWESLQAVCSLENIYVST